MPYPGANGGPIPNYDNYGQPVAPQISGDFSAPMATPPPVYHTGDLTPPAAPAPAPTGTMPAGMTVYADGSVGPDPNQAPVGATGQPPISGVTPTTAAAAAIGFPQSAWSLALHQRMANGGVGDPMDFYNFVRNRGVMPTPDASVAPGAPAPPPALAQGAPQPRPLVISATNTTPAQIIPQPAPPGMPPPGMPQPGMPNVPQAAQVPIRQPIAAGGAPGAMPGGVPQNPQMPGFFPPRLAGR